MFLEAQLVRQVEAFPAAVAVAVEAQLMRPLEAQQVYFQAAVAVEAQSMRPLEAMRPSEAQRVPGLAALVTGAKHLAPSPRHMFVMRAL
jgi:hypothetical protein